MASWEEGCGALFSQKAWDAFGMAQKDWKGWADPLGGNEAD